MSEQQYRVIADRDKGDDPKVADITIGDRYTYESAYSSWTDMGDDDPLIRIERPVPTADDPQKPELVTLHLYRDTCVGGLFLSERELDRTLHEHVEALTIRRDRLPSPSLPTREQIAEALYLDDADHEDWAWATEESEMTRAAYLKNADAVLALLQKGADA